ncbi:IS256 family transposase [Salinispora arenicola]|uniref:IS256 family transposase n=1 Tax=Salinispora arenicola TaxID=168697 RepID=UPI001E43EF90|nr:IS256 family transposase [Salinispora arenicola]
MADKKNAVQLPQPTAAEVEFAQQLVERAKADGVSLVGPGGLLAGITRTVLESALDAELDAHLDTVGVDEATGRRSNVRNGHGAKTVQTEVGPVRIQVPRDRAGSFAPRIVPKHVRRLDGFNEAILSLYAKGLTTGEISAHLADVYDADVSRELISRVTDGVLEEMEAWRQRPLDRIYPVVFIDALVMKIRQGQVANRPVYVVVGVSLDGERDVLGMWAGTGGEGAKRWAGYLTELRNRGVADVFMVCSDGLKGMTDAIEQVWPQAVHQQCVVHRDRQETTCRFPVSWLPVDGCSTEARRSTAVVCRCSAGAMVMQRSSRMGRTSLMAFRRVLRQTSNSSARVLRPQTRRR